MGNGIADVATSEKEFDTSGVTVFTSVWRSVLMCLRSIKVLNQPFEQTFVVIKYNLIKKYCFSVYFQGF